MCHPTGRVFGATDLERSTHFIDVSCIGVRYFERTELQFRKLLIKIIQGEIACKYKQESMKVREVIPNIGPIPIVIPLKLFLDLLRDPGFPRGLTDSQSYVPIFANDANHCVGIRSAVNIGKNGDM